MKRRDLLKLGGTILTGHVLELLDLEPDRMRAALDSTSVSEDRLARFEALALSLGHDVVKVTPPSQLLEAATTHFRSVRRLLESRQSTQHRIRLVRVGAKLAIIIGEILFNEGAFAAAREWYLTGMQAAREAGDQYFADIALGGLAYLPTYSGDPKGVLSLIDGRLDQVSCSTPAVAWLWGTAARAHASLGRYDEFLRSIEASRTVLSESAPEAVRPGIFSFVPAKLAFYEADGYAQLNEIERTANAAHRALDLYDMAETTEPAIVQIDHAMALATGGEIEEACRVATVAISGPHTFLSVSVSSRASQFDAALNGVSNAAVRDWRESYRLARRRGRSNGPGGRPGAE